MIEKTLRFGSLVCLFISLFASAAVAATDNKRVALVVGVGAYDNTTPLANPRRDATKVAVMLEATGFEVVLALDPSQGDFGEALLQFERKLPGSEAALFYFAGHGVQIDSRNYLLSRNATVKNPHLIESDGLPLDRIMRVMEANADVTIALVDACRDNPLSNALQSELGAAGRSLGLSRGLAPLKRDYRNSLVAFATAPGNIALDGAGENSPFTEALLNHLDEPGVEVSVLLKRVTRDVLEATEGAQQPEVVASMAREFYFIENNIRVEGDLVVDSRVKDDERLAADLLASARSMPAGGTRVTALELVRNRFPETAAAALASILIDQLTTEASRTTADSSTEPASRQEPATFDRERLAALDVDQALEQAREQVSPTATPEEIELSLGLERDDVQRLQTALNSLGYDVGTPDGAFGPRSRAGLREFQVATRAPQTGYLNDPTITAILRMIEDAPKTYTGNWRLNIYREWLVADRNVPGSKAGDRQRLATLELSFNNGTLLLDDFDIRTVRPDQPFRDFVATISEEGRLRISGRVSTHFRDANNLVAKERTMNVDARLPLIVPFGRTVEIPSNQFEREMKFVVELSRQKG